jgi:plasmid stability protein
MPSLLIRNLDDPLLARLKERAKRHRRSLQGEARVILEEAVKGVSDFWMAADGVRGSFYEKSFPDSTVIIRKDRKR